MPRLSNSRAALALSALAVAALACGGGGLFGPPEPTQPVPTQWRQTVTTTFISVPILVNGLLIFQGQSSDEAQDVFGFDAASGELRWTADLGSNTTVDDPLATDGGLVFVPNAVPDANGAYTVSLLALDARSGNQRWELPLGADAAYLYPTAAEGRVYVETDAGGGQQQISALDSATGNPLWVYPLTWRVSVRPVVADGLLIAAQSDSGSGEDQQSQVFALDAATGEPRWSFDLPGAVLQSRFVAGDGRVYYFSFDGTAVALETATGQQLWATPLGNTASYDAHLEPAYADGQLFVVSGDSIVHALDAATGEEIWQYAVDDGVRANPAVGSGQVFIGTSEGRLLALNAATGALNWELRSVLHKSFPDLEYYPPIETEPLISGGVAYFILNDKLLALTVGP